MIKDNLFKIPVLAQLLKSLGFIPVQRDKSVGTVGLQIEKFKEGDDHLIIIPPEGTRKYRDRLKTSCFFISKGAGVPYFGAVTDIKNKVGYGEPFNAVGDFIKDMTRIFNFYSFFTGKHPELSHFDLFRRPDFEKVYAKYIEGGGKGLSPA